MDGPSDTSKGVVAVWLGASEVYFDRRIARILLLGIISGFPWVLIGSSLSSPLTKSSLDEVGMV